MEELQSKYFEYYEAIKQYKAITRLIENPPFIEDIVRKFEQLKADINSKLDKAL